jgi:fucose permease
MAQRVAKPVVLAYLAFVLVGVGAGVGGVLLPAQIRDYDVDRATIGITFFTGSAGYVLAGSTTGALIHRFGTRLALVIGGSAFVLAALGTATRPPFVGLVLLQLGVGYGTGLLESVLNAYLTTLSNATTLLNRLHAFFGVGALAGPVLASWMLGFAAWPQVWLVMAVAGGGLVAGFLFVFPRSEPDLHPPGSELERSGGMFRAALRQRGVLLGTILLAVYVGLELGVGNWAFSYLVEARQQGDLLAGYTVSGYWLGLTLGRFLISPVTARLGLTTVGLMYACLAGATAAATLIWVLPDGVGVSGGFVLLGFFLGPIFPTMMAIAGQLSVARLVPTAIGVMNAGSLLGGAALPWLAGAIGQRVGIWTLMPFAVTLALVQWALWRPIAQQLHWNPDREQDRDRT